MKHLRILALLVVVICQCGPPHGAEFMLIQTDPWPVDRFVIGQVEGAVVEQPLIKFASILRRDKKVFVVRARAPGTGEAIAPFTIAMSESSPAEIVPGRQYLFAFSGDRSRPLSMPRGNGME